MSSAALNVPRLLPRFRGVKARAAVPAYDGIATQPAISEVQAIPRQSIHKRSGSENSYDSGDVDDSGLESDHSSNEEPARTAPLSEEDLLGIENDVMLPLPLGVYIQFPALCSHLQPEIITEYQPAVYGCLRARKGYYRQEEYKGLEVSGDRVLTAFISNYTLDRIPISQPLGRSSLVSFSQMRLSPKYRLLLNPENETNRQMLAREYVNDSQEYSNIAANARFAQR